LQSEYSLWWKRPRGRDYPDTGGTGHWPRSLQSSRKGVSHRNDYRKDEVRPKR
jgi:hypothetical protein